MIKIILDTNFLLIPAQFNVDIFTEINRLMIGKYELCAVDKTFEELEKIVENKNQSLKSRTAAKIAIQLAKAKNVRIIKTENQQQTGTSQSADNAILEIADEHAIVATQDKLLKQKLRKKGIQLIVLRAKKRLELYS